MSPDEKSNALPAVRFTYKQLNALRRQLPLIRENVDIECVHRARVACRRLRSGLRSFDECFPAKTIKKWRREIRRLADALGPARDKDVQILHLTHFIESLDEKRHQVGLARLLIRLKQQRASLQKKVLKAVDRFDPNPVLDDLYAEVGTFYFSLRGHPIQQPNVAVFQQAHRQIRKSLDKLLQVQDCLKDSEDIRRHHQMRIIVKQFRYVMEIYLPVYGKKLDSIHKTVKKLQTLLGHIHDCDMWEGQLTHFLEEEHQKMLDYYGHARPYPHLKTGIDYFREHQQQQRNTLFVQLQEYWANIVAEGLWDRLLEILQADIPEPQGHLPPDRTLSNVPHRLSPSEIASKKDD